MSKFVVIGAGMAGLLAAAVLRDECSNVLEAQSELPNNHSALLRFRSSIVGDTLNIPFRQVNVIKAVQSLGNPVADAIAYARKTTGRATLRSVITAQGAVEQRYIAPDDFIARLRSKVTAAVHFNERWDGSHGEEPIISTLPMPVLMKLLNYEPVEPIHFQSVVGYTLTTELQDCDVCATIYIPQPGELAYRASITGNRLIVEMAFPGKTPERAAMAVSHLIESAKARDGHLVSVLRFFGMDHVPLVPRAAVIKPQQYAKILPVSDTARKRFMLWATEHCNVYSFGRFATWRPGLLLDDLINDLRVIQRLAGGGTSYDARRR